MSASSQSAENARTSRSTPPPLPNIRQFHERISSLLRTLRRGHLIVSWLRILTILIAAVLLYAVLDYFLALSNGARIWMGILLLGLAIIAAVAEAIRHAQLTDRDMARQADRLGTSRRHPVLSALELLKEKKDEPSVGLESYLVTRSVDEANSSLSNLTGSAVFPQRQFRRQLLRFLMVSGLITVLAIVFWQVGSVLLARIVNPWKDIPPYSPLEFVIEPEVPELFYGDDATVTVEITGAPLTEPVRFLTRDGDEIFETTCFQDGPQHFAQKLERVVQPVEFAFAHGKARSEWHSIDLRLEPKIALASVTVTPPPYASLPKRTFLIGEEPLAVLRGSQVSLSVNSNRPLLNGLLAIASSTSRESEVREIEGSPSGRQTVVFEWTAQNEAELEVEIRDIRGTKNRDLFTISQRLIPDKPPSITLEKPATQMMATPSIKVPISVESKDDLGLARVEMIRTIVGYRDRNEDISPPTVTRDFDYKAPLDLPSLGVTPGETLELYFQAVDRNPSLLGVASSEVARIQIISDEEYAEIIRTRTTIREFSERFRLVNRSLNDLREALENLEEATQGGDEKAIEEARKNATDRAREASRLFQLLSDDFAAFDLEKEAIEQSGETLKDLEEIRDALGNESQPLTEADLSKMLSELGLQQEEFARQQEQAEEVAAVSELMQKSVEFSNLVREQENLTRRLKQFEQETRSSDLPFLKSLGEEQKDLEKRVREFSRELREAIDQVPPGYETLCETAEKFLTDLNQADAPGDMRESHEAAGNEDGSQSYLFSSLALEKMKQVQEGEGEEGQPFCDLAGGQMGFPGGGSLRQTLSQMLSALRFGMGSGGPSGNRPGFGRGGSGGGGMGMGGDSEDGYSMAGYSALDIPVLGPPRLRLAELPSYQLADENDSGTGRGPQSDEAVDANDQMAVETNSPAVGAPLDFGSVPGKYRDAVKRYFTTTDTGPSNSNPKSP